MTSSALPPPSRPVARILALAACGDDDESSSRQGRDIHERCAGCGSTAIEDSPRATERLVADTGSVRTPSYYEVANGSEFDYGRLLEADRQSPPPGTGGASSFSRANPSYEEMEGIRRCPQPGGVRRDHHDAGGDGRNPENAVPFDLETPAGRTFEQPGQLQLPDRD